MNATTTVSTLIEELREAWSTLQARHPSEHFYSFGIITSALAQYVAVTASTEEGLSTVTEEYVRERGGDLAKQRASLRWSPGDSPFRAEGLHLLPRSEKLRRADPNPYESSYESEQATLMWLDCFPRALKRLDEEGHFGEGLSRARLVLSVWMDDQSDKDQIRFARMLNPKHVATRFAAELEEGHRAFVELSKLPR